MARSWKDHRYSNNKNDRIGKPIDRQIKRAEKHFKTALKANNISEIVSEETIEIPWWDTPEEKE